MSRTSPGVIAPTRTARRALLCGVIGAALVAMAPGNAHAASSAPANSTMSAASPAVATTAPRPALAGLTLPAAQANDISGWTETGSGLEVSLTSDEGVATNGSSVIYRGPASIPVSVAAQGWIHIGDPDAHDGYVFDAYQGSSTGDTKMFRVTTPAGDSYEYVHTLVAGEMYNNSFDAVSPDGQWLVAGEWNTMDHLQIYPTPILNAQTSSDGGTLDLSGYIQLDHQVNDIQGCDFVTATELICASDDSTQTLFPDAKPLLEVQLAHALNGQDVTGHVIDLGPIPQSSICSGTFETEGVDYDTSTGVLRVEMVQPSVCEVATTVYTYTRN
jgi:hypothetical protein